MPHLTIEYSRNLSEDIDIEAFCDVLRDAMVATEVFPLAGIRVRALQSTDYVIADGQLDFTFADLRLRIGEGRSEKVREGLVENLYAAAENWLEPQLQNRPFALSFELIEIKAQFSEKRFNTIRTALQRQQDE